MCARTHRSLQATGSGACVHVTMCTLSQGKPNSTERGDEPIAEQSIDTEEVYDAGSTSQTMAIYF